MANPDTGHFAHAEAAPPSSDLVMPLFSLKGRTAIVTGAGGGIGLAVARAFAEAGANVALWFNHNTKAVNEAADIEKAFKVQARAYQVNVQSEDAVIKAVDTIVSEFNSRLDIFVANSGIVGDVGPILDNPLDGIEKVMSINVLGTMYCARAAGRHFRKQKEDGLKDFKSGSFIATASMSGHIVNIPQMTATYNASKAAMIHLCKSLAVEWVEFARVNSVSPGYVDENLTGTVEAERLSQWKDKTPMSRVGRADELRGAYLYLASDAASFTTGCDMIIDGGYSLP